MIALDVCSREIYFHLMPSENADIEKRVAPGQPLPFGALHTDHMFVMTYQDGAWQNPRVIPYKSIPLDPMASVLHYGGEIFEGAKAFRHEDGELYTFRIDRNAERFNASAERMRMPHIPIEDQVQAIHALLDADRKWYPSQDEASLYIRPFMITTEPVLGLRPNKEFMFCVILSPSGPYYSGGFNTAIKVLIQDRYHRAGPGGTGEAKTGGNYGASLAPQEMAQGVGASQVLYLDSTNTYIEEYGAMNHFHVTKDGVFIIPHFSGTILRSITSQSVIELGAIIGQKVRQEDVTLEDFLNNIENGSIIEAGGLGTAAVISPVGAYICKGDVLPLRIRNNLRDHPEVKVGDGNIGEYTRAMYELYTGIQKGEVPAPEGWLRRVEREVA